MDFVDVNPVDSTSDRYSMWVKKRTSRQRMKKREKRGRRLWQGQKNTDGEEIKGGAALGTGSDKEKKEKEKKKRGRESWADVPFLIPPVRGFVLWPSRKWELGRQQLTKELWRIQLAINGQPWAFVGLPWRQHNTTILRFENPCPFFFHLPFSLLLRLFLLLIFLLLWIWFSPVLIRTLSPLLLHRSLYCMCCITHITDKGPGSWKSYSLQLHSNSAWVFDNDVQSGDADY